MNLWNKKSLPPPPIDTYKAEDRLIDLGTLHSAIEESIHILQKPAVHKEAALLSRCIYRMKRKFRNDKGFKHVEKMNRALLQMLRLQFTDVLKTYLDIIPIKYEADTYLPTLNMLHYILVRLQGLSKLLVRLCQVSKTAACYLQERIHIAHMWKVAFIMFSIISRIYVLGKELLKFCCEFYSRLLPYCNKFINLGADWLPITYQLPTDLKSWLDIDWLGNEEPLENNVELPTNDLIFDVDSDSDVEFCDKGINIEANLKVVVPEKINIVKVEDIGESVTHLNKMPQAGKNKSAKNIIAHLDSLDDLKKLSKDFNKIREAHPKTFKNIDKLQFNMLHGLIKKSVKRAKKHKTNTTVVNKCVLDIKDVLKLHL